MKTGSRFWMDHVAAIEREAMSASAYAKRHGISVAAVYYWQRKLKTNTVTIDTARATGKFVSLRVADTMLSARSAGCTLVLGPGMRLEMPALPTPEWLACLAHAVQEAR